MEHPGARFLTAEWLHLAILNFEIDPAVLRPFVPVGTELAAWQNTTYVSLVGFQFRKVRVLGLPIPFHRNFDEVNLRFYVRCKTDDVWRRGVVFIKEFAPRRAVAWTARMFFGENYATVPMGHHVDSPSGDPNATRRASYWWTASGREHRLDFSTDGPAALPSAGTTEEFITEHYWGYSDGIGRATTEYRVDHARWNVWTAREAHFDGDAASLYGQSFVESLTARPASAFMADGSSVAVFLGRRIA